MRAIVTGGAGFIGSHVVELLLAQGHDAVAVDNLVRGSRENLPAGARLVETDITDVDALAAVFAELRP